MVNPVYPYELAKSKIKGDVLVEFIVSSSGQVVEAHAVSSPHPAMAKAAVEAILHSEFRPGTRAGKPTATKMRVPFTFDLKMEKPNQPPEPKAMSVPSPAASEPRQP